MKRDDRPPATIGQLLKSEPRWFWAHCLKCRHVRAVALAPFAIRWGMDVSSDMIRRNLKYQACGAQGCELKHPSFVDIGAGWQPFPVS